MRGRALLAAAAAAGWMWAQPPVAPTDEAVGPRRGENRGNYNIQQSFETGYRLLDLDGNRGKYRSDVNFRNGIRLLGSSLRINSRDGQGRWFDELILTTQGLGNDPYQFSNLKIEKNKIFRYDSLWRANEYFNPALPIAGGQHVLDTRRRMQDHDFKLLPQAAVSFFAGFSRVSQDGPGLTTYQLFDSRGDEFPLLQFVRRRQNEFRVGNEVRAAGFKLHWMRAWENYAEDTWQRGESPLAGNNPNDRTTLNSLRRNEPYRGRTPSWRVNLLREQNRYFAVNGRFTHAMGRRNFALDDSALGTDRLGAARNRQVLVAGNGRRPVATGHLTVSIFPAEALTLTNHTLFHSTRMEGDASYRELSNANLADSRIDFQYLGIRNVSNTTEAQVRLRPWLGVRGGYQYARRRIRSVESITVDGFTDSTPGEQENRLQAGTVGFNVRPSKRLLLLLDGELGRNTRPFLPTSERNYHGLNARLQYRTPGLTLSALARTNYNFNSVSLFSHSAKQRVYSFDAAWTPRSNFAVDLGYAHHDVDTLTGLVFFAAGQRVTGDRSVYASRLHIAHLQARWSPAARVDLSFGYSHSEDAGATGLAAVSQPALRAVQTFPMRFLSPQARISVKIHEKLRWNAGYQRYGYSESWLPAQNYGANTAFTSVLWSF